MLHKAPQFFKLYLENALYEYCFYKTDEGRSPESVYKNYE